MVLLLPWRSRRRGNPRQVFSGEKFEPRGVGVGAPLTPLPFLPYPNPQRIGARPSEQVAADWIAEPALVHADGTDERQLTTALGKGFVRNPQVTVVVQEYRSQSVFVFGACGCCNPPCGVIDPKPPGGGIEPYAPEPVGPVNPCCGEPCGG